MRIRNRFCPANPNQPRRRQADPGLGAPPTPVRCRARASTGVRPGLPAIVVSMLGLAALLSLATLPGRAAALEAFPAGAFHRSIGINAHLGYSDARFPMVREAFRDLGIRFTRGKIAPSNAWRARALWDCCGVRTIARIDARVGDPARSRLDPSGVPGEFATALGIGSAAIAAFEGPNEYNHYIGGDWAAALVSYQRVVYNEAKRRRLPQPVVGPSIYERDLNDIRRVGNIGAIVDAANLHFYAAGNQPSHDLDVHIRNAQLMAPGEPLWVTEFGYHNALADRSANAVSETTAARYVPRLYALLFSKNQRGRHFLYELIDSGSNRADKEHNFGLIRSNGARKPAYHTLKRLIGLVEGGEGAAASVNVGLAGELGGVRSLLLQKGAGQYVLLLWQEVTSWDRDTRRTINWPDKTVTVSLPRSARVAVHDTLPYADNAERETMPRLLNNVDRFNVAVPDHIVGVEFRLN